MADVTITAANVRAGSGSTVRTKQAAVAISPGELVYVDTNSKLQLTDNTTTTKASCAGVAINYGEIDGMVSYVEAGEITLDSLTAGVTYAVSSTANGGKFEPVADLTTGDYITTVFTAFSTTKAIVDVNNTGQAMP